MLLAGSNNRLGELGSEAFLKWCPKFLAAGCFFGVQGLTCSLKITKAFTTPVISL